MTTSVYFPRPHADRIQRIMLPAYVGRDVATIKDAIAARDTSSRPGLAWAITIVRQSGRRETRII